MRFLQRLVGSSLGKKLVMAITGAGLFVFAVGHMLGNLQLFIGPEAINGYAHFLQSTPEILWVARIGLLGMVVLHVWAAVRLTLENYAARPVGYDRPVVVGASYAARTMIWSGFIVAAFIIYHLLHYTVQAESLNWVGTDFRTLHDGAGRHDVYRMVLTGFSNGWVAGFYTLAVGLLCWHLSHGLAAMFQSLGLKNSTWGPLIDGGSRLAAWVLFLGYVSVPVAVFLDRKLGWIHLFK